ncbi:MAG: hypothetical protein KBD00_01940 [Candidatus Peribacteraceae bacterium]|nr:hypothetical protein [Candidatus Peribacteraceae bacterium]
MWTVIVTLAVAWNPVGLKVGSWLSIQFGILYRDVEAVINAPAAVAAVPVGPPTALPTVGATTPASTALAPVAVINKSMWTVGTDGLITFNPPPSGWKWMVRANSSTPPFEPPPGFGLLGASNAEVYLQSVADPTKVTTALWLK